MPRNPSKKPKRPARNSRSGRFKKRNKGVPKTSGKFPITEFKYDPTSQIKAPFSNDQTVKLYYADSIPLTVGTAGISTEYVFRLNSIFDPDLSGTGHQPYGHDTLALIYLHYEVMGCYVKLEWSDPSADGMYVGYQINGGTVVSLIYSQLVERPWSRYSAINDTGNQVVTQNFYVSNQKASGLTSLQYKAQVQNNWGAAFGANPTSVNTLRCAVGNLTATTTPTINLSVRLCYVVRVSTRNQLAQS